MNGPELLHANADWLKSNVGGCFPGSHAIFRGHDLHVELKDMDWIELYAFGITGRRFSAEQLRILQAVWTYTSYPDARIWNNRVAALAGSSRSTAALALSAALAVSEAKIYGGYPIVRSMDFFQQAQKQLELNNQLEDIVKLELEKRRIYGFGRPINSKDERLPWLLSLARELSLDHGPHLRLAFEVERILTSKNKLLKMNYAGMIAAFAADFGFSLMEFHLFVTPIFLACSPPCYIENVERPEGTLFPLSC